jgi:hypothetical protein
MCFECNHVGFTETAQFQRNAFTLKQSFEPILQSTLISESSRQQDTMYGMSGAMNTAYQPGWQSMDQHARYHHVQQQQMHGPNYINTQQPQTYSYGYDPAMQQNQYYNSLGPQPEKKGKSRYIAKAVKGLGKVLGGGGSSSSSSYGSGHSHGHVDGGGHGDSGGFGGGDGGGSSGGGGDGGGGGAC